MLHGMSLPTFLARALVTIGTTAVPVAVRPLAAQVEVSFPTPDGGIVYADLYGAGPRTVVLAHGGRYTKASWEPQATALAKAGFRILAIDFRGRGRSHGGPSTADGERFDVLAAVRYLRGTGAATVSVVGASMGGGAAALAAVEASPGAIDRLVLLAATPIATPERLGGRKLFIVSRGDTTASGVPRLVAIRRQYDLAPEPKELVVLEGTAHAQLIFPTDQGKRLLAEILRFLSAP